MCMNVLLALISLHCMCTWCLWMLGLKPGFSGEAVSALEEWLVISWDSNSIVEGTINVGSIRPRIIFLLSNCEKPLISEFTFLLHKIRELFWMLYLHSNTYDFMLINEHKCLNRFSRCLEDHIFISQMVDWYSESRF